MWAGKAAEEMGLTGLVDPEAYRDLFGELIAPTGERLYSGRPPRYAADTEGGKDEEAAAAVAALDELRPRPSSGGPARRCSGRPARRSRSTT